MFREQYSLALMVFLCSIFLFRIVFVIVGIYSHERKKPFTHARQFNSRDFWTILGTCLRANHVASIRARKGRKEDNKNFSRVMNTKSTPSLIFVPLVTAWSSLEKVDDAD